MVARAERAPGRAGEASREPGGVDDSLAPPRGLAARAKSRSTTEPLTTSSPATGVVGAGADLASVTRTVVPPGTAARSDAAVSGPATTTRIELHAVSPDTARPLSGFQRSFRREIEGADAPGCEGRGTADVDDGGRAGLTADIGGRAGLIADIGGRAGLADGVERTDARLPCDDERLVSAFLRPGSSALSPQGAGEPPCEDVGKPSGRPKLDDVSLQPLCSASPVQVADKLWRPPASSTAALRRPVAGAAVGCIAGGAGRRPSGGGGGRIGSTGVLASLSDQAVR